MGRGGRPLRGRPLRAQRQPRHRADHGCRAGGVNDIRADDIRADIPADPLQLQRVRLGRP